MMTDYEELLTEIKAVTENVRHPVSNLANVSALIYEALPGINWAGFYLYEDGILVLGPFQGKAACIEISPGKGVCGTALLLKKTVLVENVHEFPGHIPCDSASNSEIVVPVIKNKAVYAVLDIDSPEYGRFGDEDKNGLEKIAKYLENAYI